jgi:hypothetical protein
MSATFDGPATDIHQQQAAAAAGSTATQIVLCLGPWYEDTTADHLAPLLQMLRDALRERTTQALIAYPAADPQAAAWQHEGFVMQPYASAAKLHTLPVQTAATYLSLYEIMRAHDATCGLLLGPEAHTLHAEALRAMVEAVLNGQADLALPCYTTGRNEGLVNASILYPLTRAVYGVRANFPLALDLSLSSRMAERMATAAQSSTAASQPEALLWPAAEAAVAGFSVAEINAGTRELPHPTGADLSSILNTIGTSLFTDIELKASYWQRTRPAIPLLQVNAVPATAAPPPPPVSAEEISELVEGFRIGYGNLHEIWALVLPPQTLLGLKRMSRLPTEEFALPDALWVRIVYDYVLAHRLRTINRGHLMGSLTPLYLAWVASHIMASGSALPDALPRAFDADKPYLVSRWRWPDRFNP